MVLLIMRLIIAAILGLMLSSVTLAAVYDPILDQIKPGTITIIGETHKKPESVELFQNLIFDTLKRQCVVLGLEIASDQQTILDATMQGRVSVSEIKFWPAVDHPAYRRMIEIFAELKRQDQCIKVIAIDSSIDNAVDRDLWMASSLEAHAGNDPMLVLLGALHTLKRVDWKNATGQASVAEILTTKGFSVNTYPQRWLPGNCADNRVGVFVDNHSPLALELLNKSLTSLIKARPHKSAVDVIDGFIVWECEKKENINL